MSEGRQRRFADPLLPRGRLRRALLTRGHVEASVQPRPRLLATASGRREAGDPGLFRRRWDIATALRPSSSAFSSWEHRQLRCPVGPRSHIKVS